jgi:cobaltochelatase CobS
MKQHYFLTREKTLVPVELISETPFKRQIKFTDNNQVKTKNIHPEGVAWGNIYPRLFATEHKPEHIFSYKGRTLVQTHPEKDSIAIPTIEHYRFQPFLAHVIDSIHSQENVLLTGGTGVGKTTHILQMAARIKQPVLRINFNGETRMSDLIGKVSVIGGATVWGDGVLPYSMRHGYWLLLDELDFADPAVLSLLHPVLEENGQLVLKENGGEIIKRHPDFRIFATANSIGAMQDRAGAYGGTNQMNEAFLDRWQVILVDNLPEKEELLVIRSKVKGLTNILAKRIIQFANKVRNQDFNDGFQFSGDNFSTRKVLSWAKKTALHRNPIIGAKLSWLDKMPKDEQELVMRILSTHFGKKHRSNNKNKLKVLTTTTNISSTKKRGRPANSQNSVLTGTNN